MANNESALDSRPGSSGRTMLAVALLAGLIVAVAVSCGPNPLVHYSADPVMSTKVPAPSIDETAQPPGTVETAVLAGGCFWGVQGVFQHVEGVTKAESGYAGGDIDSASYESVGTGSTGHAESVRITYDPSRVTYGQLLQIFFTVVHDPTQLNRQGPDVGPQYRSAIFAQNDTQQRVAEAYIAQLSSAGVYPDPIVTRVEAAATFYPAERYHQDFLTSNPTHPYIVVNDIPKVEALEKVFPDVYRDEPVLVLTGDG